MVLVHSGSSCCNCRCFSFIFSAPLAWFRLELFSFICDAGHSWLSSRTSFYFCCSPFAISHFATAHKMWATRIKRVCVLVCVRVLCVLALTLKNGPGKSAPHTPHFSLAPHTILWWAGRKQYENEATARRPCRQAKGPCTVYGMYGRHAAYLAQIKNIYIFPNKTTRSCPAAAMPSV